MSKLRSRLTPLLETNETFRANLNANDGGAAALQRGGIDHLFAKTSVGAGEILVLPEGRGFEAIKAPGALSPSVNFSGANLAGTLNVPAGILIDDVITGTEIDFFAIDLVAGETYVFSAYGSGATPLQDTILLLADPTFNFVSGGYGFFPELADDDGGAGTASLFTYTATTSGTFFVGVGAFAGTGQYTLDAVQQPATDDVSDDPALATPLTIGQVTYGFIEAGPGIIYGPGFSEVDTYSFTVEAGKLYTFELAGGADYNSDFLNLPPGELDTFLVIYDADGNVIAENDDINFPGDVSSRVSFFATESGTYYLDVRSYQPWTGGFSITSQAVNPADFDPLDSLIWRDASNVPFDAEGTAYVYFAPAGVNFGESDDGVTPLPSLGWNAWEMGQVMLALEQYEHILGVNYEITTDVNAATFRLITTESQQYGAYMYPQDPAFGTQQGIGVFNTLSGGWTFDQQQSLVQGGFSFAVMLHEFGHAHGLAHPHDTGGGSEVMLGVNGAQGSLGVYDLNQGVYTVMSYNDAWQLHPDGPSPFDAAGVDNGWSGTLSAFDIAALQQRYGIINAFATGNDTYLLDDANEQGTYYQTIWDTGGSDVIRYDGARAARIDLLAATIDYSPTGGGVLSFVDDIWGGYTIAEGVVIENATGGSGDDALLGNSASNVLRGNGGADVLIGRGGADTLIGGPGFDIASYIDAGAGVRASLALGRGLAGDAAGDRYTGIEGLQGSAFNDVLSGGDGGDRLDGLAGADSLSGGDGADIVLGGGGADNLSGGDGTDGLDGGDGNDVASGGDGGDTIVGGAGDDRLTGGDARDLFVFNTSDGLDTVTDFRRNLDDIDLRETTLVWADLDTSGNGALGDNDDYVAVIGGRMILDLGAAAGGLAGLNTVTLLGVIRLAETDFLFGP